MERRICRRCRPVSEPHRGEPPTALESAAMSDISRRGFFGAAAAAAIGATTGPAIPEAAAQVPAAAAQVPAPPPAADETLALVNGRIHTMDGRNTVARAVTIRNGRFITVGDAAPRNVANMRTIDLVGRTAAPQFI